MSTIKSSHGHNEACCNMPPVVSKGYQAKGTYAEVGGMKTYVTGPDTASKGIIVVYDIFGYLDQTLQGADMLATGDAERAYRVLMPDWFGGSPCPIGWYPPGSEDKQKKLGDFFGRNPPPGVAATLPAYVRAAQEQNPHITSWGVVGFCWGAKAVSLVTSGAGNPFAVAAECHPAMVDPKDAEGIKVPLVMLASGEEPEEAVRKFEATLSGPKHVEIFGDQIHGWMAARADLADPRVKDEYTRGYETILKFFAKHWP